MSDLTWSGVMPAVTTPFRDDLSLDLPSFERHCAWLAEHGASALIPLGSLGEGATLQPGEKVELLRAAVAAAGGVPVVAAISALATRDAVALAVRAEQLGCRGLMVLPPYLHHGPWPETRAHFDAVLGATTLPVMAYNNPIAYGADLRAEQILELADRHPNLQAVKESSGDVRRVTALRALAGDRLAVSVGLDDMVVEGVAAGATGWVAGLVNALPAESMELFAQARRSSAGAFELYRWFLPLLRLDTVPEFVQLIKLVQQEVGMGSERVRPPRQPLTGDTRQQALAVIRKHLATRPAFAGALPVH